jgi:hypothetical protein
MLKDKFKREKRENMEENSKEWDFFLLNNSQSACTVSDKT